MLGKIEGTWRRGWQRMKWLDSIIDSVNLKFEQTPGDIVEDRGNWHTAVHGVTELDMT